MFLNHLEIYGFKSFPAKLELKFGDGITGIVGPNGCGKTNIVDAIRWVLGEQKPTLLRSEQMGDVIFNGTTQRKPLGMAEVSLTIDNTRSILAPEFSEVMITRRLFRSGESEYLLNKTLCRRKDIVEMFMDTGMGPHAYSIIELPMVESILSGQTEALRALFEEAAGIAKYKAKRREAFRKLEVTKQNLLRIGDIVDEVEKQVRGLARQAAKAKRYQNHAQELRELEVTLAGWQHRRREEERERLRQQLEKVENEADQAQNQLTAMEAQEEKLRHHLTERRSSLATLHIQLTERGEQIHKMEEEILVSRERKEGLLQQVARIQFEMENLRAKLEGLVQERKSQGAEAARVEQELRLAERAFAQKEKQVALLDDQLHKKRSMVESARHQVSDLLQERNDLRGESEKVRAQRETAEGREQRLTEEIKRTIGEMDQVGQSLELAKENLGKIRRKGQHLEARLEEALGNRGQLTARLQKLAEEERELTSQVEIRTNRLELLQGVLETYEGYEQGVKAVLTELSGLSGIRGTLADVLQVDPKYVQAVEAAMGSAAQYILVDTVETAAEAMECLRRQKAGRASFLILDRVPRGSPSTRPEEILARKGALAWAPEVVTCHERYRAAADFLLDKVVIVDDLSPVVHRTHQGKAEHITWTSLSGDVLEATSVLRGGHPSQRSGLLDRQQNILREKSELDSLSSALKEKRAQRQRLETDERNCSQKIDQLQRTHQTHSPQRARLEREVETLGVHSKALLNRRAALTEELEELRGRDRPHDKLSSQLTEKLSGLESQLTERRGQYQLSEEELARLESKSRVTLKQVGEAQVQLVSLQGRCEQLRLDAQRLGEVELELKSNLDARRMEISDIQERIKDLEAQIAAKDQEAQERRAEKSQIEVDEQQLSEEESTINRALQDLEQGIKEARAGRESIQNQVHDSRLQLAEIEAKQQAALERIQEEYQVDLQDIQVPAGTLEEEGPSLQEREKRIQFLRERIQTAGPVNLAALEEYNAQKERYDFLTGQRDDLLRAEQNLNQAIEEMNRRAHRLFTRTFKKVNQNFQSIFRRMFDGGEANLILNGKPDPLEANIEIFACPGGKKLRHIAQLSGGEKALTAISLLFSLYQVKPSPFCVLDEVDAPLDDANIGRFVNMVKNLSQKSQFIIITHNKITMAAANVLYGVTMEESGISKVVSVNLRQREKSTALGA